jgi:hypothetical protein
VAKAFALVYFALDSRSLAVKEKWKSKEKKQKILNFNIK